MLRYAAGVALGLLVLLLLVGKRSELAAAWRHLAGASAAWVAAAIAAEALSLLAYAWLQQRVLRLSGTSIRLPGLFLLTLANDAIANSVPGEPAVSSAYRYRYYRRRGASGASAGWTIFTILIAQAIGMSLVLLLGVVIALAASTGTTGAGVTIVGLVIVLAAGAVLIRRDLVLRLACCRRPQSPAADPAGRTAPIGTRIEDTLARMREIPLTARSTAGVVAIAAAVWCCDFLCLLCSFRAVHSPIPWAACCWPMASRRWRGRSRSCPAVLGSSRAASLSCSSPTGPGGSRRCRPRWRSAWSTSGSRSPSAGSAQG